MKRLATAIGALALVGGSAVYFMLPDTESDCLEFRSTFADYSHQPPAKPTTQRCQALQLAEWDGEDYLYLNRGNGLKAYLADSVSGKAVAEFSIPVRETEGLDVPEWVQSKAGASWCAVPPSDYDWVLYQSSTCDGCRFGAANLWRCRFVVWENLTVPLARTRQYPGPPSKGVFTYQHGGHQYLIGNQLQIPEPDPAPEPCILEPAIYRIDSVDDVVRVGCVGYSMTVSGGLKLGNYLYLSDEKSRRVRIFELGSGHSMTRIDSPSNLNAVVSYFGHGMRTDGEVLITATGYPSTTGPEVLLWDVTDPAEPARIGQTDQGGNRVAVRGNLAYVAQGNGAQLLDISNPAEPIDITGSFFDSSKGWNQYSDIIWQDLEFSRDGERSWGARHSVAQEYGCEHCPPPLFYAGFETGDSSEWSSATP